MWLKWPPTLWLLAAVAVTLLVTGRMRLPNEFRAVMIFPCVFFALAMTTNLNLGDRYVLPVYPFLLLLCAGVWDVARVRPPGVAIVVALVACQFVDGLRYAPDYLSYFNLFVPPGESYMRLTDSNLDWGQGLIALRDYERAHPDDTIWLAYFGGVDPASYGIRARRLGEGDRVHGTVMVSATHLSGQYLQNPAAFQWLTPYRRRMILNHTLHLFEVP